MIENISGMKIIWSIDYWKWYVLEIFEFIGVLKVLDTWEWLNQRPISRFPCLLRFGQEGFGRWHLELLLWSCILFILFRLRFWLLSFLAGLLWLLLLNCRTLLLGWRPSEDLAGGALLSRVHYESVYFIYFIFKMYPARIAQNNTQEKLKHSSLNRWLANNLEISERDDTYFSDGRYIY